jgi:putative ABC transport system permease protein
MFKQYFKQAIHALRENRLTSVVSILGTMLSVAMILVVVLQFQIKLVGYSPVSKRDRMLYIYSVNTKSKDGSENNNTGLSAETIRECLYTLKKPEAVTVTAQNSHVISIPGKRLFEEYTVYYTERDSETPRRKRQAIGIYSIRRHHIDSEEGDKRKG